MSPLLVYILLSLLLLSVCIFAIWKGGPAERVGATVVLVLVVIERTSSAFASGDVRPYLSLTGDALTALGLLAVTLRYGSPWLGGVMLFYAAQFALHSVYLVTARSNDEPLHVWLNNINFAGILVCLTVGTLLSLRRRLGERRANVAAA